LSSWGIEVGNIDQVLAAGARRVVVVRAITEADDPAAATRALVSALRDPSGMTAVGPQ
jgi:thiamine-phosphate pyrophosphorylase